MVKCRFCTSGWGCGKMQVLHQGVGLWLNAGFAPGGGAVVKCRFCTKGWGCGKNKCKGGREKIHNRSYRPMGELTS